MDECCDIVGHALLCSRSAFNFDKRKNPLTDTDNTNADAGCDPASSHAKCHYGDCDDCGCGTSNIGSGLTADHARLLRVVRSTIERAHGPAIVFLQKVIHPTMPQVQLHRKDMRLTTYPSLESLAACPAAVMRTKRFLDTHFPASENMSDAAKIMHILCLKFIIHNDPIAFNYIQTIPETSRWYIISHHQLAVYYSFGFAGCPVDYSKAVKTFEECSELGNVNGTFSLGVSYETGLGVTRDVAKSKEMYQKAIDKGNILAMFNLALLESEGHDPDYEDAKIIELVTASAKYGGHNAIMSLAGRHIFGTSLVPQETNKAVKLFLKVARCGSVQACTSITGLFAEPSSYLQIPEREDLALLCLHLSVEAGCPKAPAKLAKCYLEATEGIRKVSISSAHGYALCAIQRGTSCDDIMPIITRLLDRQSKAITVLVAGLPRAGAGSSLLQLPPFFLREVAQTILQRPLKTHTTQTPEHIP